MKFTILNDAHQSLCCNDCLDDELLDLSYSEVGVGTCDYCGWSDHGTLGANSNKLLILALNHERGAQWALNHGIPNAHVIPAGDDSGRKALEGRYIDRDCIFVLPEAERGQFFEDYLARIQMTTAVRSFNITIQANMQPLKQQLQGLTGAINLTQQQFQSYNRYLYGTHPIVTSTNAAKNTVIINP